MLAPALSISTACATTPRVRWAALVGTRWTRSGGKPSCGDVSDNTSGYGAHRGALWDPSSKKEKKISERVVLGQHLYSTSSWMRTREGERADVPILGTWGRGVSLSCCWRWHRDLQPPAEQGLGDLVAHRSLPCHCQQCAGNGGRSKGTLKVPTAIPSTWLSFCVEGNNLLAAENINFSIPHIFGAAEGDKESQRHAKPLHLGGGGTLRSPSAVGADPKALEWV